MAARSPAHASYAAAAAALLCTFALLSGFAQADCGGFVSSCSGMAVSAQGQLTCRCSSGHGEQANWMNLNNYISNDNGNLVDGAGFVGSCKNIQWYSWFTGQGVCAQCKRTDGSFGGTTYYNLNARVANYNGNLHFNNCRRLSLLQVAAALPATRKMLNHE